MKCNFMYIVLNKEKSEPKFLKYLSVYMFFFSKIFENFLMILDFIGTDSSWKKKKSLQSALLDEWLSRHGDNLYPRRQEKERLARDMCMTYIQVHFIFVISFIVFKYSTQFEYYTLINLNINSWIINASLIRHFQLTLVYNITYWTGFCLWHGVLSWELDFVCGMIGWTGFCLRYGLLNWILSVAWAGFSM